MSSPGSAAASVDVTRSQTPADANNIDKDGDDEPVLPEKLSFLLQQSSIYSRIIADKLARDTLERQRRDAKADTRKNNKAKKQAERDNQAGRDTRSGNAAGAVNKTGQQKKPARGRVSAASKQSDSYNGDGNDVKARDFTSDNDGDADADASIQVHSGARVTRQGNNPRTRLNAKEAPAKQVASALGLNGRTAARNAQNKVANGSTKPNGTTRSQNGKAKEEIMDLSSTDDEEEEKPSKSNGKKGKAGDVQDSEDEGDQPRQAKEEDEEGEDDDDDDDDDGNEEAKSRQPSLVKGATMKSYQLAGMEWLISLYENGLNGILADEMGLGKTLQTIAFLSYLREKGVWGPFLVVCPLSTLANWVNEFERFTPDFPALLYHGTPKEREDMREERMRLPVDMHKGKRAEVTRSKRGAYYFNTVETFPVVVTSYELVMHDRKYLSKYDWKYLIIDESHRIKNMNCKLIRELMSYKSANRLLLTGTPLQNNLEELWSLLNFLMPEIFDDLDSFQSWFDIDVNGEDSASVQIITKLHSILKPFLLRRVKREVEKNLPPKKEYLLSAALTMEQKKLYDAVIKRQIRDFLLKRKDLLPDEQQPPFSSDDEDVPKKSNNKKAKAAMQQKGKGKKRKANADTEETEANEDEDAPQAKRSRPSYVEQSEQEFLLSLYSGEEREKAEDFEKLRYGHIYDKQITNSSRFNNVNHMKLQNMVMQCRKVCNHPWLFEWPMDPKTGEYIVDKRIVTSSGKMMLLDRLLTELVRTGHKCLVFSQFTSQLDIIEDWAEEFKGWRTMRIDGLTKQDERRSQLKEFNEEKGPDSCHLFLLSTRSGGVGINLTGADTVILYDSDWNPQMDLQAMDRVHRLGQTNPVLVFRLVTANTVEAKMLERAGAKRKLEALVIGSGKYTTSLEDLQDIFTGNAAKSGSGGGKEDKGAGLAARMFAEEMKEVEQGKEARVISTADEAISDETLQMLLDRSDEAMLRGKGWKAEEGAKAVQVIETGAAGAEDALESGKLQKEEEDDLADFFHGEDSAPGTPLTDG